MDDISAERNPANAALGPTGSYNRRLRKWLVACYPGGVPQREPFTIDLADATAISKALARVEREVGIHESRVREAVDALRYWQTMYDRLAALALRGNGGEARRVAGEPVRKRLLRLVNESPLPVDVDQAGQLIPNVKRKTISWTLWDLARKGEIQKITDGLYASLEFQPSTLLGEGDS